VFARIIFSVPVSSAGIERLFSEAGMLLTKQRKRMLPKVMNKLVYIWYEKKYRKWTLSDSKIIYNDTKHRAASLRQMSFLFRLICMGILLNKCSSV